MKNPVLALVYSNAVGGFSILGKPKDFSVYYDFNKFLREKFFNELKSRGIDEFEFSVESEIAEKHILELFSDKSVNKEDECFYRKSIANEVGKVDMYSIVKVDSNFTWKLHFNMDSRIITDS